MKSVNLLGTLPAANDTTIPAILLLQKTPFDFRDTAGIAGLLDRVDPIETNDIVRVLSSNSEHQIHIIRFSITGCLAGSVQVTQVLLRI